MKSVLAWRADVLLSVPSVILVGLLQLPYAMIASAWKLLTFAAEGYTNIANLNMKLQGCL